MDIHPYALHAYRVLALVLVGHPDDNPRAAFALWLVRLVTLALLVRTYIAPFVLGLLSTRARVRSISLRSIRGLYLRTGVATWRVERIKLGWRWASKDKTIRLTITVEGLRLELVKARRRQRKKTRTMVPTMAAHHTWSFMSTTGGKLLRQAAQGALVLCLRLIILTLPTLTQILELELDATVITLKGQTEAKLLASKTMVTTRLVFTQGDDVATSAGGEQDVVPCEPKKRLLRDRISSAWRFISTRNPETAWASTQCIAAISVAVDEIVGYSPSLKGPLGYVPAGTENGQPVDSFLVLPQGLQYAVSARLLPKTRGLGARSLKTSLDVGEVHIGLDILRALLDSLKSPEDESGELTDDPSSPPFSPAFSSTFSSPTFSALSPMTSPALTQQSGLSSPAGGALASPRSRTFDGIAGFRWASMPARAKHPQLQRLKKKTPPAWISSLKHIKCRVSTFVIVGTTPLPFKAKVHQVAFNARISDPEQNALHRRTLGQSTADDGLPSDVYAFDLSLREVSVDRVGDYRGLDDLRVLLLGPLDILSIVSHWPSPWLAGPQFLAGDPNAALVATEVTLDSVRVTERLEILHDLLSRPSSSPQQLPSPFPRSLCPVPRVSLAVHVADICGRLICPSPVAAHKRLVLEAKTQSIVGAVDSQFVTKVPRDFAANLAQDLPAVTALRANADFSVMSECITVGVRSTTQQALISAGSLSEEALEPLLLLDPLEFSGVASALGHGTNDPSNITTLDLDTAFVDALCATDALSVELWQPDVLGVVQLLASLPSKKPKPDTTSDLSEPTEPRRLFDRLPAGLSVKFGIRRFTAFATAPDLNPADEMDLSRGVALRTTVSLAYAAMSPRHTAKPENATGRGQARQMLALPEERIVPAAAAARAQRASNKESAFVQFALVGLRFRSAVATPFVADDPYCEHTDAGSLASEFLRVPTAKVDVELRGFRMPPTVVSGLLDVWEVTVNVPEVRGTVRLAHVYSTLLAAQRVKSLVPKKAPKPAAKRPVGAKVSVSLVAVVEATQIIVEMPLGQSLCLRADVVEVRFTPTNSNKVYVGDLRCFVPRGPQGWDELARIQSCTVQLPRMLDSSITVKVDGGAQIRIPHRFMVNELVRSITVTNKSLRHLVRMVAAGEHSAIIDPQPEGPKSIPKIHLRLHCLVFEAADDPFESKLALSWQTGLAAAKIRTDREEAFEAKVAAVLAAEAPTQQGTHAPRTDYHFDPRHAVPIDDARYRLHQVHSIDWIARHRQAQNDQRMQEEMTQDNMWGQHAVHDSKVPNLVNVLPLDPGPPLLRVVLKELTVDLSAPSFSQRGLPRFLRDQGGLPLGTEYSLLVPLHLSIRMSSLRVSLRDYPLPMINIPPNWNREIPACEFDTDLVVAEEMGPSASVDWLNCLVIESNTGVLGAPPLFIDVPKTIMPVKTYASPMMRINSGDITDISWGVSYGPVMQDLLRLVDTLTSPPQDPSPPMGFWDKMRLQFHWKLRACFAGEVHLHIKGSRDPHTVLGSGSGFAFCWQGNPRLDIGYENAEKELIQVISDRMLAVIPDIQPSATSVDRDDVSVRSFNQGPRKHRKVCAKLGSGVRFGLGFAFERTCGDECTKCTGTPFDRTCRHFQFKPHYDVKLRRRDSEATLDSFAGFRSDFLHMSVSLESSLRKNARHHRFSSFHLSPQVFSHFWSWWSLFNRYLSLQVRQGALWYKNAITKVASPKLGRHLATIKYRIAVPNLFISHVYADESKAAWADGVTPFVGIKALIEQFQADLHQREEETTVSGPLDGTPRVVRQKPFNAAELVMKGLDLRALLATYSEPLKQSVTMDSSPLSSNFKPRHPLPALGLASDWVDPDDFMDVDWAPTGDPTVHLLRAAACPQFTYFKRSQSPTTDKAATPMRFTKFGDEDTHVCYLGTEASVSQVQMDMAKARIAELRRHIPRSHTSPPAPVAPPSSPIGGATDSHTPKRSTAADIERLKMIALLDDYVAHLKQEHATSPTGQSYYMPSDSVQPDEWADFDHVYQVHCPKIFLSDAVRDVMMQYYYCSRARRGFEYHMATRAVKFIRDQAEITLAALHTEKKKAKGPVAGAQNAANALRKMLNVDGGSGGPRMSVLMTDEPVAGPSDALDPLSGWSEGVSLMKAHFCLLLKPQIVLRSESNDESVCTLAAVQAKMQSFTVLDNSNADDPVSGRVMNRSYTSLNGLQMFSPTKPCKPGHGFVPLEVLVDLRCESSDFDRLVPQTDATFHYDKFNRLRLRNTITSVVQTSTESANNHLQHQTDLMKVHVPQFTVAATGKHFQAISDIVTNLLLHSDAAHKTRSDKLETLLFRYDFTDLTSAAHVVEDLQARLRQTVEAERVAESRLLVLGDQGKLEILRLKAHVLALAEELTLIFDAIKLAQDKADDHHDQKSALLLRTSSSEISWRMLDERKDLLAKLAVRDIDYSWLSRQDSSTVNKLVLGDLQAFAGSPRAVWAEMLSKHDEPANHPLVKKGCFLLASWTLLPPVGGITIYANFEMLLHPIRLQVDTRVGRRIMEYVWPERKRRKQPDASRPTTPTVRERRITEHSSTSRPTMLSRASLDSSVIPPSLEVPVEGNRLAAPSLRRLGTSRSFTDLRSAGRDNDSAPILKRNVSGGPGGLANGQSDGTTSEGKRKSTGDAEEMRTRSSQKTFVLVRVGSLHVLLSIMKEQAFLCQDARVRTRDLEYRNQTWSFEELVDQFIPSDPSWKGWIKLALHQPLVPVLPVARELISKTKWIASKGTHYIDAHTPAPPKALSRSDRDQLGSDKKWYKRRNKDLPVPPVAEPSVSPEDDRRQMSSSESSQSARPGIKAEPVKDSPLSPSKRHRVLRMLRRTSPSRKGADSRDSPSSQQSRSSAESGGRVSDGFRS